VVLAGIAFVLVAAACSNAESVTSSLGAGSTTSALDTELESETPLYPVSPAALDAMPEAQAAAVADGTVTEAEFERAVLALVACLEGSGLEVTDFSTKPGSWSIAYASPSEDSRQEEAIYSECYIAHVEDIESYYLAERQPTAAEDAAQHETDRIAMIECLQAAGVDISDDADEDQVRRVGKLEGAAAYGRCFAEVKERAGKG